MIAGIRISPDAGQVAEDLRLFLKRCQPRVSHQIEASDREPPAPIPEIWGVTSSFARLGKAFDLDVVRAA